MITSQRQVVEQLKTGLQQMEVKLGELKSRRDQLVARKKSAEAQVRVQVQAVTGMRGGAGAMKSRCPWSADTLFRTGALVPSVRRAWGRMRCRR